MSNSKDNSQPFWRSIRGVGRPGTHRPTWEGVDMKSVPYREIDNSIPAKPAPVLKVQPPTCQRCGLRADEHPKLVNTWYCHFCLEEVKAPMRPNASIPLSSIPESGLLEPALTDPKGEMICPKCATSRRPRADNQGFVCACKETYTVPGVRRVSPTNGF